MVANQNLLTYSEQMNQGGTAWATSAASVTADQIANPVDGLTTADKIVESSATDYHYIYRTIIASGGLSPYVVGSTYTYSIYVKKGTKTYCWLPFPNTGILTWFNLDTGLFETTGAGVKTSSIALANGWYRLILTYVGVSATGHCGIGLSASNGVGNYAGNGTDYTYCFGAQLVQADWAGPYTQTVATVVNTGNIRNRPVLQQNLLTYSQTFANASWTKTRCSVADGTVATLDPLGGNNATDFIEDGSNNLHRISGLATASLGKKYTYSCYIKAAARTFAALQTNSGGGARTYGCVNLTMGETSNDFIVAESVGNGWWRVSVVDYLMDTGANVYIYPATSLAFSSTTFQGVNGQVAMYIFGTQLVQANWAGPYTATTSAIVSTGVIRNKSQLIQNLFTYSEAMGGAGWNLERVTFNSDAVANPVDGLTTADQMVETTDNGLHRIYRSLTTTNKGSIVTGSFYAKANTRQYIKFEMSDEMGSAPSAVFDLSGGTVTATAGGAFFKNAGMVSLGNGWYRCWMTVSRTNFFNYFIINIATDSAGTTSYVGDTAKNLYVFGGQIVEADWLSPYVKGTTASSYNDGNIRNKPRVAQNLLLYSEQFDNAYWVKSNTTVSANTADTTDPLGTNTADKWIDSNDGGAVYHSAGGNFNGVTAIAGTKTCCNSIYAKQGTKKYLSLTDAGGTFIATFDLNLGTITEATNCTPVIESIGNGWYRCSCSWLPTWTRLYLYMCDSSTLNSYQGDGTGTIYLWGAQAVESNWPGAYTQTTSAVVNTGTIKKKIITVQNLLRYSEQFDNALWNKQAGTIVTADQATAPDGTMTADLIDITATAVNQGIYAFSPVQTFGRANTKTIWLKGVAGGEVIKLGDSVVGVVSTVCTLTTSWQKFSCSDVERSQPLSGGLFLQKTSGNQFYAWGAQMNVGLTACPYIKTLASVENQGATRA